MIEIADGDEMVYRVTTGEATPFLGVRLKMDASLSGLCVREDKVLRSDDTETTRGSTTRPAGGSTPAR